MCPNSVRLVGKRESYASRVEETNEDIQAKIRQRKIPRRHEAARHRDGRKRLKKDATVRREAAEITPALLPHTLFRGPGSYRKRRFCCAPRMRRAEVELSRRYHAAQSRLAKYVSPFIRTKKIVRPRGCWMPGSSAAYLFNTAGQFSTSVIGSVPSFKSPLFTMNFFPSAVTSYGP
jgi:hypothetical protein